MEKNKNIILNKLSLVIITLIVSIIMILIGVGNFFVDYAILRTENYENRKVDFLENKVNDLYEIEQINEEEKKLKNEWKIDTKIRKVSVKAKDRITLRGTEYIQKEKSDKWAIILHGYRGTPQSVFKIGLHFLKEGYNILIPSMRASNESDGKYIGMGWLDKDDLKEWINLIVYENKEAEIVLHGSSMGGATVLMASGDKLPENVKAIVEDSGYTSVWDIFESEAKARFNLPSFPILNIFQTIAKAKAKYDIKEASALEQVKKATIPILFIHGDSDNFVPTYMCEKLYDACNAEKEKLIVKGAGHVESQEKDGEKYYKTIFDFLEDKVM